MSKIKVAALLAIVAIVGCSDTEQICPMGQRLSADGVDCVPTPCEGDGPQVAGCACPDGQVLDGGACVDEDPCAGLSCDDGNPCTEDACGFDGACSNVVLSNGTTCDRDSAPGICESGSCVDPPSPCLGDPCDDGNECTNDVCTADGLDPVCDYVDKSDGVACTAAGNLPGTCEVGVCVDLCAGVDCSATSQCVEDGVCNPDTGRCVAGADEARGTACTDDGGGVCDGGGSCVECVDALQCTAGDACNEGICGVNNECEYVPLTELAECSANPNQEACYEGACRPVFPDEGASTSVVIGRDLGSSGEIEGTLSSPFGDASDTGTVQVIFPGVNYFDREVTLSVECENDAVGLDELEIRIGLLGQATTLVECGGEVQQIVSPLTPLVRIDLEFLEGAPGFLRWSVLARVTDVLD